MKTKLSTLLLGAGLLAGCVVDSEQPFYLPGDLVFDERLLGEWREPTKPGEEPGEGFLIERTGTDGYRLRDKGGDGKEEVIELRLFKLGGRVLADHRVRLPDGSIGRHQLSRIDEIGETLKLSGLNHGWVKEHLRTNPKALAHRFDENENNKDNPPVTLAATTAELQAFILKHGGDPGFFGEPSIFERVKPAKSAK